MAARKLYGESDDTYNKRNSMTGYTYKNAAEMEKVRDQYMNREDFKYDLGSDMLYQQARDQYKALGKMAMQDTIGRASSLTGGYANSYAASAGNQAYNQYLQALNENIPDYYAMALDAYEAARKEYGDKDVRNTIEHIEVLHRDDLNRFAETKTIASIQPTFISGLMRRAAFTARALATNW